LKQLGRDNNLVYFNNTTDAYNYLEQTRQHTFLVICALNLPGFDGLGFKKKIDSIPHLRRKSIPFIFYTTWAHAEDVEKAYGETTIQGFFKKGDHYLSIKSDLKLVLDYWDRAIYPDSLL